MFIAMFDDRRVYCDIIIGGTNIYIKKSHLAWFLWGMEHHNFPNGMDWFSMVTKEATLQ